MIILKRILHKYCDVMLKSFSIEWVFADDILESGKLLVQSKGMTFSMEYPVPCGLVLNYS
jgi:hypothetical protein